MSNQEEWKKLWDQIKTIRRNADKREKEFARDMRTDFPSGEKGDAQFIKFVENVLEEPLHVAQKLLALAVTTRLVSDEQEYKRLGIDKCFKYLMGLSARDQEALINTAKEQNKVLQTVITERERVRSPRKKPVSLREVAQILSDNMDALEAAGIRGLPLIVEFIDAYMKRAKAA